ncbi:MAG: SUMF1/EgtB/PvdO family nonheme iron enzyme, partial [Blastocatellia bacterium]
HFAGGLGWIGHHDNGFAFDKEFAFDNESPRHQRFLQPFLLASRPVTNGEYLKFIEDGGYEQPLIWLSDGWRQVKENGWIAPLYWNKDDGRWRSFTLAGMREIEPAEPVCHVSYFEADAYARWSGARLPDEAEWEVAAAELPVRGNFVESERLHPAPLGNTATKDELHQVFGDVWEWTRSAYSPYPGYRASGDALGEYNGKFMCNQYVLRGGSCATSRSHMRPAYRNFFAPDKRWQFSGIRLAKDCL